MVSPETVELRLCSVLSVTMLRELVPLIDKEALNDSDFDPFVTASESEVLNDDVKEKDRDGSLDGVHLEPVIDLVMVLGIVGRVMVSDGEMEDEAVMEGVTLPRVIDTE